MAAKFEELAWTETPIGAVALYRRVEPVTKKLIYEVKLRDEYLMSSLFTAAEIALSTIGLAHLEGEALDVVVGGLGLGYTAEAALEDARIRELLVVEFVQPVIDWHQQGLIPAGEALTADARCRFVQGDFFAMSNGEGFDPGQPGRTFDAILLDIDHSPQHLLADGSMGFYGLEGMTTMASRLRSGGVFALWSNDPPDSAYMDILSQIFDNVEAEVVSFPNPLQGGNSTNTVYVANAR